MPTIVQFPVQRRIRQMSLPKRTTHRISVEILDLVRPRRTRWLVQFEIQEVAGFGASTGFKDQAVASEYVHPFTVKGTANVVSFVSHTAPLVRAGKIAVHIDGVRVRPERVRRA